MAPPNKYRYQDPLSEIWLTCARRIGFAVARTRDAYAHTDGHGTIFVAEPDLLDPDDNLAQMLLHELCHALVEGPAAWRRADWGLDNQTSADEPREQACLRLQAALAAPHGLRRFLAATTEHRGFYDALPGDPLTGDDPAALLAREALTRARRRPFAPHLDEALAATAQVAAEATRWQAGAGSLWSLAEAPAARHPTGLLAASAETCGGCGWLAGKVCIQTRKRVNPAWGACVRWEGTLDCQTCAACCRDGGYDAVPVGPKEAVVRRHPELVVLQGASLELKRGADACLALRHDDGHYACTIYEDRPRACRGLPRGRHSCLDARRRLGMSAPA